LKNNRHLQLAIYAEMLRQSEELWPSVAYYILDAGQLYVTDTNFFPSAQKIFADTGEGTAHLWQRFVATWEWRQKQIEAGIFELVFDDVLADEDSQPPEDGLPIEMNEHAWKAYVYQCGCR
jgi:hypothetical protein